MISRRSFIGQLYLCSLSVAMLPIALGIHEILREILSNRGF